MSKIKGVFVTRGEINQTIYREYITSNPMHARLIKGAEIARYEVRSKVSQGHQEWFNECDYLNKHTARPMIGLRRIATQRITGVDEKLRIVATITPYPAYYADSTNSIVVSTNAAIKAEFILALLNSKLMQWRFKLTSTNNNVGTNELESLPFRRLKGRNTTTSLHWSIKYLKQRNRVPSPQGTPLNLPKENAPPWICKSTNWSMNCTV